MQRIKEKKERALGTKLFLKAERCSSPKCATIRKPYKPGMHGQKKRRRRPVSEYGKQLQEKQRIQITYGLTNKQMRNLFKQPREKLLQALEQRLDRVIFLLGIAPSPRVARQFVSHGHIVVNGRRVTTPSYRVKVGDVVSVRQESRSKKIFEDIELRLKQHEPPSWLKLNKKELKGECVQDFTSEESNLPFDMNVVGQFYSR